MLAELKTQDTEAEEKIKAELIQKREQEEWVKEQQAKEAKNRLLEAQRKGVPLRGPAAKKPSKKDKQLSAHRVRILHQLVSKEKRKEGKPKIAKLNKTVPKVFQRLNSIPVNSYKHFLNEARRRKMTSNSDKQVDLRTSDFLAQELQLQRDKNLERALTAPPGRKPARRRREQFKGNEYERLKIKLANSHLESPYNELRNRGLMSPWEKRSEELLKHFARLAKSDTPQSLITALPDIKNKAKTKEFDDRIQNTLKRFETLTSPAKKDLRLSFEDVITSGSFFGPYDYDDTLKLTRMIGNLEQNSTDDARAVFKRGRSFFARRLLGHYCVQSASHFFPTSSHT